MNISDVLDSLKWIELDSNELPSKSLFYNSDFKISITSVTDSYIKKWKKNFNEVDLELILVKIKDCVKSHCKVTNGTFYDIKSIDVVWIFIEIVRLSLESELVIEYDILDNINHLSISSENFNYFNWYDYLDNFDEETKEFVFDGWRFSTPSIGVEESIVSYFNFSTNDNIDFENISYDFINFIGNRDKLSFKEIENLIDIFNNDLSKESKDKITSICLLFKDSSRYFLVDSDGNKIEFMQYIELGSIFDYVQGID